MQSTTCLITMQNIHRDKAKLQSLYIITIIALVLAAICTKVMIDERAKRIEVETLNSLIIKNADPFAITWAHTRMDYPMLTEAEVAILANFRTNRFQLK